MCRQVGQLRQSVETVSDTWSLVWCYKQCFQSEWQQFRRDLKAAKANQGSFLCLRNSNRLEHLIGEQGAPNQIVLLTDWREAKPCWQVLSDHGIGPSRFSFVVYTEGPKQFNLAKKWADDLPRRGAVHIISSLGSPGDLVDQMDAFHKKKVIFGSGELYNATEAEAGLQPLSGGNHGRRAERQRQRQQPKPQGLRLLELGNEEGGRNAAARVIVEAVPLVSDEAVETMKASWSFCFTASEAWRWSCPVAEQMCKALPSQSPSEVLALLLAAVPQSYEE